MRFYRDSAAHRNEDLFTMTNTHRILLLVFACLMSIGQLLFKHGATRMDLSENSQGIIAVMLQPSVLIGLTVYATATILWIRLLQSLPLSSAYPYASLAFVIVPVSSIFLFGETLSLQYFCGMCLIVLGVAVIGVSN